LLSEYVDTHWKEKKRVCNQKAGENNFLCFILSPFRSTKLDSYATENVQTANGVERISRLKADPMCLDSTERGQRMDVDER